MSDWTKVRSQLPSERIAGGEEAHAALNRLERATPKCAHCGKPATCLGSYERPDAWGYACDDCCGHGNEHGTCGPVTDVSQLLN